MSRFQMVGTKAIAIAKALPFENLGPSKSPDFKMFLDFECSDFRSPLYGHLSHVT